MRQTKFRFICCAVVCSIIMFFVSLPVHGQYFGRNKVVYETYRFAVMHTDRFNIYFYPEKYPEGARAVKDAARMAERWYARHAEVFGHQFTETKPVILYENQTDFHQTNIISGDIGEGTGGITEGLKNRLFMPLTGSYAETDHVLGHEMVHVFQ